MSNEETQKRVREAYEQAQNNPYDATIRYQRQHSDGTLEPLGGQVPDVGSHGNAARAVMQLLVYYHEVVGRSSYDEGSATRRDVIRDVAAVFDHECDALYELGQRLVTEKGDLLNKVFELENQLTAERAKAAVVENELRSVHENLDHARKYSDLNEDANATLTNELAAMNGKLLAAHGTAKHWQTLRDDLLRSYCELTDHIHDQAVRVFGELGTSGNPKGRPRKGNALTESIQAGCDVDELRDLALDLARNG